MMYAVRGKVAALVEDGFVLTPEWPRDAGEAKNPREINVRTQIPGPKLSLSIGDRVSVSGGFGNEPGVFLSSGVTKFFRNGSTMDVHVNTMDTIFGPEKITPPGPEKITPPPKRPWWRLW